MTATAWGSAQPGLEQADAGTLEVPLDGRLRDLVEAYLAGGPATPAVPRDAATVMLVRPAPKRRGSEVFMLRRVAAMAFAAGAMVFPGGRVDEADAEPAIGWAGPSPQQWALRMACPVDTARAVVVAAVRELFEETGVLLAGSGPGSVIRDLGGPQWAEDRARLACHELSMAELVARHGLVLRTDLLGLRSHWLTPEFEPRRYDTYFFAAAVPEGQTPASCTTEASEGLWARPHQLFVEAAVGRVVLLPPTAYNLRQLDRAGSPEQFVAEEPPVDRIMLAATTAADGTRVLSATLPGTCASPGSQTPATD